MFDLSTDLEQVVDGLESVTLLSRSGTSTALTSALRRDVRLEEATASFGKTLRQDCIWHLPKAQLPIRPELGAKVRDAQGEEWMLLAVEESLLAGRWRCQGRNLALAFDLQARISIETPHYSPDQHGASVASWQTVQANVPARIQPLTRQPGHTDGAQHDLATHLVLLPQWELTTTQARIRNADGELFEIARITQAERLGEFTQLEVRQVS